MSGFQFGAGNTAGGLFGSAQAANTFKPPSFGSTTPSSGLFGTNPSAPNTGLPFGVPAPTQNTGLAFGTPVAAQNTGLPFGTSVATQNTGLAFGTPTVTQNTGLSFGAPAATQNTGLTFGTPPVTQTTGLTFGAPASTQSTGLMFGAPASTQSTGLNFGTGTAQLHNPGLPFGAPASSVQATNLFPTQTPSTQTSTLFATASSAPSLSFGAPASTGQKLGLFGTSTTTTPALGTSTLNTGLSFGAQAPTSAPFNLNFNTSTSTAPTLNFGAAPTSTTQPGLPFGSTGFNLSKSTATTQANIGLGGIASTQPKPGTISGKSELNPKEQPLPNELQQTVQGFKDFVKKQKSYSSDVARCSIKEFKKVESEIDLVNNLLNAVEKQLQNNRGVAEKLKYDTSNVLQHVEIAQRTFDTPPGLQYDNSTPLNFFMELADKFERDMHALKIQIDNTDKYVKNLGKQSPLTSQDLTNGMRKLHETFVALAGRLQSVHSQVENQKEQYLNLRKYMLHDDTNIFEKPVAQSEPVTVVKYQPPKLSSGPTPFNSFMNSSVVQQIQAQNPPPAYPGTSLGLNTTPAAAFGVQPQSSHTVLFGNTSAFSPFNASSNSPFQLQKPPVSNKRGKQ